MTAPPPISLLEPSFATALAAIEASTDLSAIRRTHWACSLRKVGEWLDRPLETIAARWTAVRIQAQQLHHAPLGVTAKTLANHKANAAAALRWFNKDQDTSPRGIPLTEAWSTLRDRIQDRGNKRRLYAFFRYCSGAGISPAAVSDGVLEQYFAYRGATTALAVNNMARRSLARSWNACVEIDPEWPQSALAEPALQGSKALHWDDFPIGLRRDLAAYLAALGKAHKHPNGRRARACSPNSLKTRRAELAAFARKAVACGVSIEELTSLPALVHPDVVEKVIEAYWQENGDEPKTFTIDLGWKLLSIARHAGLPANEIERLEDIRARLEEFRRVGLTRKNIGLIRKVITPGVWMRVLKLPAALLDEARSNHAHAPVKAAVAAQMAIAVALLCFAPIRLENLVSIKLGTNLHKPGGLESPYHLSFPDFDVKNRVELNFELDEFVCALIDEYVHKFRPTLMRGWNSDWLFPGETGEPKTANMFSGQITGRIEEATGLRITAHQFRHAAAAIWLQHNPGDYESVRQLLGHKSIQTTTRFYCALEPVHTAKRFGQIIREKVFAAEDA